jgi:hypothetical protein
MDFCEEGSDVLNSIETGNFLTDEINNQVMKKTRYHRVRLLCNEMYVNTKLYSL